MAETLKLLGRAFEYEIGAGTLHIAELGKVKQPRVSLLDDDRRVITKRTIDLGRVRQARLEALGDIARCELTLDDGTKETIINDDRASRPAYGRVVEALHGQLAEHPTVRYVRGSWTQVGIMVVVGLLLMALGLAIHLGWFEVPPRYALTAPIIVACAALCTLLGPLMVWESRPHAYDPRNLPAHYVR